jgi:uncharacterized membrane protein YcaP (DUF421 family)
VALGSTLATVLLPRDVALAEGATALALLVALQFAGTWLAVRSTPMGRLLKSTPTLLLRDGRPLREALRQQRVTEDEVYQAVRSQGHGDLGDIGAVVLETDGTFSVIPRAHAGASSALRGVAGVLSSD